MPTAPACFNAISRLVPLMRAESARRLIREGLAQERIAEHLGVSQAMVSKYLRRPAARDPAVSPKLLADLVDSSVKLALREEARGGIPAWCPVCDTLNARGLSCALQPLANRRECLRHEGLEAPDRSEHVLRSLVEAEERLRRLPFARLLPEVRSNLAMAMGQAQNVRDVAAFPGRIIDVRGEIRAAAAPEFGASSHLASILLKLRRHQPRTTAILNVRYGEDVQRGLRAARLKARVLRRARGELVTGPSRTDDDDAVIDPGAFGIEPALYLLGDTAIDVVDKTQRLLQHVPEAAP